jgi:hypothetical protein
VGDRVYPIRPPPHSSIVCLTDPLAPLAPSVLAASPSLDLVPPLLLLHLLAPPVPNHSSSSTSLGATPLLPSLPLSGLARPSSPKTRAHDLCRMGRRTRRTAGVTRCCTDSIDHAAYRSSTCLLWWMGAPTTVVVEVWQGSARSMMALSEALVVLGVGPLDQW